MQRTEFDKLTLTLITAVCSQLFIANNWEKMFIFYDNFSRQRRHSSNQLWSGLFHQDLEDIRTGSRRTKGSSQHQRLEFRRRYQIERKYLHFSNRRYTFSHKK